MSLEELDEERTLGEYLRDVDEMELSGRYPRHSGFRRRTLAYWEEGVAKGIVSLSDPLPEAIEKMRRKPAVIRKQAQLVLA